eukprot:gnl/MRDRNA2_/MRDRNA2_74603_c0_seq1.p1 gnl/MRDRNA2_/MRDRNA2_74603_c0~~gnl/MRDRNA2_/MRDRNA2_74603_c0_seq1.p1  ORF type:complete len:614 (+),score=136.55 gnl/MRDRNA2_/MRDRNA2_74603_c0_seq1:88-1929(+)
MEHLDPPPRTISKNDDRPQPGEMFRITPTGYRQFRVQGKQLYKIQQEQQLQDRDRQLQHKWKGVQVTQSGFGSDLSKGAWVIGPGAAPAASTEAVPEVAAYGSLPKKDEFIYENWNGVGQPGPDWIGTQEQGWWLHPTRELYYSDLERMYFKVDEKTKGQYEVDPFHAPKVETDVVSRTESSVSGPGTDDPSRATTKTVLIKDLISVGQALKSPLEFLDKPASMFAVFAKAGEGMECVDFCAKNLHAKLLKMFRTYHGHWDNSRVQYMMQSAFTELENDFVKSNPEQAQKQGCSVGVCLLLGSRLFVAACGACRAVSFVRGTDDTNVEVFPLVTIGDHAAGDPATADDSSGNVFTSGRIIGCLADIPRSGKANSKADSENASAEEALAQQPALEPSFVLHHIAPHSYKMQLVVLVVGERVAALSQEETFEPAFQFLKAQNGFPKAICGAISRKVAQNHLQVLSFAVDFLTSDRLEEDDLGASKVKRAKAEVSEFSQVRVSHILLRFVGCKLPADLATKFKKKATRTREDAENAARVLLLELLEKPALFPQRAQELSECNSALKSGVAAGDLGWIGLRSKVEKEVKDAAFGLQKNQLSDVVVSESGCHILLRMA